LLSNNISPTCPHNMVNFGPLRAEIVSLVWGTPANFNGFRVLASLLHRRRTTEVKQALQDVRPCPGLLRYAFRGLLPRNVIFATCKIHFASKSCVLLYCQRYYTALEQWASAKLCGVQQGVIYSAERPSRLASAHILVYHFSLF